MKDMIKSQTDSGKSLEGGLGTIDDYRGHPGSGTDGGMMKQEQNAASFPEGEKTTAGHSAAEGTFDQVPVPDTGGIEPDLGAVHAAAGNNQIQDRSDLNVYERLAEKDVTPTEDSGWFIL